MFYVVQSYIKNLLKRCFQEELANIVDKQKMENRNFAIIIAMIMFLVSNTISATDTITHLHPLTENQTLVSKNGEFELGFFSPRNSDNRYLGIWYKKIAIQTIVWVANREEPVATHISALLTINITQNSSALLVLHQNNSVLWSVSVSRKPKNPILQLLDSGNLVLREENDENEEKNYLWQSFDYPGDTLLPEMKLGKDLKTGLDRRLSAWKNESDPSPGSFTWEMDVTNWPEPMQRIGSKKQFNSGPWTGLDYSGKPTRKPSMVFNFTYFSDQNEVYFMFHLVNTSVKARMVMNQSTLKRVHTAWDQNEQQWKVYALLPRDFCDEYGSCGPNGNCDGNKVPACQCLRGFKPKSPRQWNGGKYDEGCVRDTPLDCKSDGFVKYVKMKVPDTEHSWLNQSMNLVECREKCFRNCSCMAYSNSDTRGSGSGSGCAMWFGDLNDLRVHLADAEHDLYVRVPASVLETNNGSKVKIGVAIGGTATILCVLLLVLYFIYIRRSGTMKNNAAVVDHFKEEQEEDLELPLFDLSVIASATNNFSIDNKLGEGGFGPVYKGTMENGQEIAVKRLSRSSGQGLKEFKNEIVLIAKLQHRNLVKLHGCCIHEEEKLLVYEYMPNKSLDLFIFDETQRMLLDWSKRFQIICGIARGILYLHQDSILKIIHRDLKASNVLLDSDMNPKISDFGLAKIFKGDQSAETTGRVVGTYGYMAPEYAIDGNFSVKSDVFSFGILLLEIVSGKKNKANHHDKESTYLVGYAWDLWTEERHIEVVDEYLKGDLSEALRCIHISLLCVQQNAHDRPNMSSVVMMLSSEISLPQPNPPALFLGDHSDQQHPSSLNELSITTLEAR
ncbi:hypothetical protein AHAS_Ahas18G0119200 [Arachis hypogaea]